MSSLLGKIYILTDNIDISIYQLNFFTHYRRFVNSVVYEL